MEGQARPPLRVGILGAGMIASVGYGILPNLVALADRVAVVAIASRTRARADKVAARFAIPAVYDDLTTMLAEAELDAVVNLTPIPDHFATSMEIIAAGKHLVTEKPIALTLAEADAICEAADQRGVVVVTAPVDMLAHEWSEARRLVRAGAIGRVSFARLQSSHGGPALMSWPADPRWFYAEGAGPLFDMGVYGLHRVTGVLGPARRVSAFSGITSPTRTVRGGPFDAIEFPVTEHDNTIVMLDFGESCFATVDATFNVVASRSPAMEVYGSEGTLIVHQPGVAPALELFRLDAAPGLPGWVTPAPVGFPRPDRTKLLHRGALVEHLVDCIDVGVAPTLNAAHARHVLEIMLAARTSAATGAAVELTTTFSTPDVSGGS